MLPSPVLRLLPLTLVLPLFAATTTLAQPSPRPARRAPVDRAPSHVQLDLARGERILIRATGKEYAALDDVRPMHILAGRLVPSRGVTARLGPYTRGGRWIEITATSSAPPLPHRLDGLRGRSVALAFPLVLDVQLARRGAPSIASASAISSAVFRTAPRGAKAPAARSEAALASQLEIPRASRFLTIELYRDARYTLSPKDLIPIPGFGDRDHVPGSGTIEVGTAPNTQVFAVVPESLGIAGATIEIQGQELPACEVRLAGAALPLESSTSTKIVARLPAAPVTGDLILVRSSDGVEAILAEDYVVQAADAPKAFDLFDADATTRTWKHAYLLSLLSWIVYFSEDTIDGHVEAWGLTQSHPLIDRQTWFFADPGTGAATGSTQAAILYGDDAVFVAFRGSTTHNWAQDWIDNDLDPLPLPKPTWGVTTILHHGFHEAMVVAYADVLARVQPLLAGRKLWITGHSLGGAVAVLTAYRLEHEAGIDVQGVHIFGAPPVGNGGWAASFAGEVANVHRWNIERDPVPVLYPWPLFFHVGTNNDLYTDGHHVLDDPQAFGYVPGPSTIDDLKVVHMDYWNRLRAELEEHDPQAAAGLPEPPPAE